METNVSILSMNVRGISSSVKKRTDIFSWVKDKKASVVCLQETHSSKEVEKDWEDEWGGKCYFSHHSTRSAGVCVMFKQGLDFTVHDSIIDSDGRYIILDVSLYKQRVTLTALYGFNTDNADFFHEILCKVMTFSNTSFLFCGDWNVVQDCSIDNFNIQSNRNPNCRKKIEEIKENLELVDPWRICHPEARRYTWRQSKPVRQSRLDYFLVSDDLFSLMKTTSVIPGYRTDHSAVMFTYSACLGKRGRGYWKFNSQLLRDREYVNKVKNCIKDTTVEYYLSGDNENLLDVRFKCDDQLFSRFLR